MMAAVIHAGWLWRGSGAVDFPPTPPPWIPAVEKQLPATSRHDGCLLRFPAV